MSNIIIKKLYTFCLFSLCGIAFLIGSSEIVNASKTNLAILDKAKEPGLEITLGKAEMVTIEGAVSDILVADPSIVDVMAIKSDRLYIVGSSLGDTNIIALDENGDVLKKLNIHVRIDTDKISSVVEELYPDEDVQIKALTDQVVLLGEVSTPAIANQITNLVGNYAGEIQELDGPIDEIIVNMMGVRGEQQIMLKVKILEVARSAVKDLGVGGGANITGNDIGGGIAFNEDLGLTAPVQFANALLNYTTGDLNPLSLDIRALEQEGVVNTLAEPNLTAISGEQAGFLAGGEFPIPTQIDENGNLVYEFRPFGVSLNFRPQVMSKDRISLQLTTEVSTATFERNLQLQGINVPTFNVRRAETTVELPSGGTLMIAGLIQSESIAGLSGIPGVSDVPVVGDLLESDTFQRDETELLVMITPYTVAPFADPVAVPQVSASLPETMSTPVQNYSAAMPKDKPISIADLPIEPVSIPLQDRTVEAEELPISLPVTRQKNKTKKVFRQNIEKLYGSKAPEKMMDSMHGFGYVLD
ncbi:MAG: type II and III secretion system protein family protein [Pseudomonadota bacterium]